LGQVNLSKIDWAIVGGESGAGARPMDAAWVRSLRDQCQAADVAFFFKQWGGVHKSDHGRRLDGRVHSQFPARTEVHAPDRDTRRQLREAVVFAS